MADDEINEYSNNLKLLINSIKDGMGNLNSIKEEKRNNYFYDLERKINEAHALYESFNISFREMDKSHQQEYIQMDKEYKTKLKNLTAILKKIKNDNDRRELGLTNDQYTSEEILNEAKHLQKQSREHTKISLQITKEIIESANDTLDQLKLDKSKLDDLENNVVEMNGDVKQAQKELKSMLRKISKDKITRFLCVLTCLIILAIVIFFIVNSKTKVKNN